MTDQIYLSLIIYYQNQYQPLRQPYVTYFFYTSPVNNLVSIFLPYLFTHTSHNLSFLPLWPHGPAFFIALFASWRNSRFLAVDTFVWANDVDGNLIFYLGSDEVGWYHTWSDYFWMKMVGCVWMPFGQSWRGFYNQNVNRIECYIHSYSLIWI